MGVYAYWIRCREPEVVPLTALPESASATPRTQGREAEHGFSLTGDRGSPTQPNGTGRLARRAPAAPGLSRFTRPWHPRPRTAAASAAVSSVDGPRRPDEPVLWESTVELGEKPAHSPTRGGGHRNQSRSP